MKKLLLFLMLGFVLTGCNNAQQQTETQTQDVQTEQAEEEAEFTQQDFCFYGEPDETGESKLVMWIGMAESKIDTSNKEFYDYYLGFDGGEGVQLTEGNDADGNKMNVVNYLNYTGARKAVMTTKGIVTRGYELREGETVSSAQDVMEAYGVDLDNENVYSTYTDENNYVIALYFNIDTDNNVTRLVSDKNTDVSDIKQLHADYALKFLIIDNNVCGIQMYRDHNKVDLS